MKGLLQLSKKNDVLPRRKIKFKVQKLSKCAIVLLAVTILLAIFGIVMIFSASQYYSQMNYGNKFFEMTKQMIAFFVGIIAMMLCYFVDYHFYQKHKNLIFLVSVVLLCLVFVPGIGTSSYGATRWIRLPGFTIQPSEIAKFGFVIFVSGYLSKNHDVIKTFGGILPVLCATGIVCLLVMLEPNMSITMCIGTTSLLLLFVGGASKKQFLFLLCGVAVLVPLLIVVEPYRLQRLVAFLDPWQNPKGEGYQLLQSLYSIGAGGIFGVGLFNSRQKYLFLPFAESDFIFSIICEELGFFGALIVMLAFLLVIVCGIKIAKHSVDRFGALLASGIVAIIATQVLINIAVVTGSIPPTGVPLPFVSSGGTSLVVFMGAIGILLNIDKQSKNAF